MSTYSEGGGSKLHELLGKAITDEAFAAKIVDPERQAEALQEVGIEPTPEVLEELNHSIHHLRHLWETFGPPKLAS
jgi:hypothetical protein